MRRTEDGYFTGWREDICPHDGWTCERLRSCWARARRPWGSVQWGDHFALRDQLGLRAEEIQRRDLIIGQLTQANAALAARVPELETPQTSEDGTQEPVEDAGRAKRAGVGAKAPQNASERVPWWRRVLGEGR